MLRNLVENAVEHSPAGDIVVILVNRIDDTLQFAVEDRGPGISMQERERVFEPFYRARVHGSSTSRGAGLGLAIAREIVRAHGGDIQSEEPRSKSGPRFVASVVCAEA